MTKTPLKIFGLTCLLVFSACGENISDGPNLSGIEARDHNYFNEIYNRCSINNTTSDCNCVARINVEHRSTAYDTYAANYETLHKPELEAEIAQKAEILAEKTKNRSDERVLEALEADLHRLEQRLSAGIDNIDDFNLPFLPSGVTDVCILDNPS